jgi:hypothetical protein
MKAAALIVIAFVLAPRAHAPSKRTQAQDIGSVAVHWSIGGGTDPGTCARFRASAVDVSVSDDANAIVARVVPRCSAFVTVLSLQAGSYRAFGALLDDQGNILSLGPAVRFAVNGGRETSVTFDFPPMG